MCTIGYCKDIKIIFKNRDKDSHVSSFEEIVVDSKIVAARTIGADYYCWGINRYGCSFVSAAVNTPKWGQLLYDGKVNEAENQYQLENDGLINPMKVVSYMLSNVKHIDQWVGALEESKLEFKGYNLLIADHLKAYHIELYKKKRVVREINNNKIITNHFMQIDHGPKKNEDYPSTFRRLNYASNKVDNVNSIEDIKDIIKPKKEADAKQIWRDGVFKTISSSILSYSKGRVIYSKELNESYSNVTIKPAGNT